MGDQFGGVPADTPAATGKPGKTDKFGGVLVDDPVTSPDNSGAASVNQAITNTSYQGGFGFRMGAEFGSEVGGAITQLGTDVANVLPMSDKAIDPRKNAEAGIRLPLDVLNAASSPVMGAAKGAMMIPAAALQAGQPTNHPEGYVPAYTDEHGVRHPATVLSPQDLAAYKQHEQTNAGVPNPYFKESRNRPRPLIRGTTEEIAGGLTDAVMSAASLVAPESAGRLLPTEAAEAAARAKYNIPSMEEIRAEKKAAYAIVDNSTMRIKNQELHDLHGRIAADLKKEGFRPKNSEAAHDALDYIKEVADQGEPVTMQTIDHLRRVAGKAGGNIDKTTRQAARMIKDHLDDYVDDLADNMRADRLEGNEFYPTGVVDKRVMDALKHARDMTQREAKADIIADALKKAELGASSMPIAGYETALRREFRKILTNKRLEKRWTPAEREDMERLVTGGSVENFLKFLSKFAVRGVGSAAVSIGGSAALGLGAGTLPVLGEAAKLGSTAITANRAKKIDEMVRAGRAGQAAQALAPKQPSRFPYLAAPASAAQTLAPPDQQ